MADVLPLSSLPISSLATLSGFGTLTIPNTAFYFSNLSNTNPYNNRSIVFQTIKGVAYIYDVADNTLTDFAAAYKPGTDFANYYAVTPLSSYGWVPLTVGTNVSKHSLITTTQSAYLDHAFTLWMNINHTTNANGVLRCYPIANIYDPQGGQHTRVGRPFSFNLSAFPLNDGDKLNFFIGAGPHTAGAGYYWSNAFTSMACTTQPPLTTEHAPVKLSEYYHQDYDVPLSGNPVRFSNFLGAVNYWQNTLLSVYSVPLNYNKTISYYGPGNRVANYTGKSTYLGDINGDTIIRAKHSDSSFATNSAGHVSSTYAMLNGILVSSKIANTTTPTQIFLQKNGANTSATSTTYTETTISVNGKTYAQVFASLGLGSIAPQTILNELGLSVLDPFTFATSQAYFYFGFNTQSVLNRLVELSNQTNPSIQYAINDLRINNFTKTASFGISKRTYTSGASPLCYKIDYTGLSVTTSLSALTNIAFGDVFKVYLGCTATPSIQLNLQNTLILYFH